MPKIILRRGAAVASVCLMGTGVFAQADEQGDAITDVAGQLQQVMDSLAVRAEGYPAFITELQEGLVTIEQADTQVGELIEQLRIATAQMDEDSDIEVVIDDFVGVTQELISEAEASPNQAIKDAIPELEVDLAQLRANDQLRADTVVEALNLIRSLEQNREAIAFFIRAGQVSRASALIQENINDFVQIVEDGQEIAAAVSEAAQP